MTAPFNFTDRDLQAAKGLLALAPTSPGEPMLVLTDEEIVALDGLQHDQLAPTPWLDATIAKGVASRELLSEVAMRGLVARGILVAPTDGDGVIHLRSTDPTIPGVLMLRRTSSAFVQLKVVTAVAESYFFGYVFPDEGAALHEVIDPTGMHFFTLSTIDALVDTVTAILNPFGVEGSEGSTVSYTADQLKAKPGLFTGAEVVSHVGIAHQNRRIGANFVSYAGKHSLTVLTPVAQSFEVTASSGTHLRRLIADGLATRPSR